MVKTTGARRPYPLHLVCATRKTTTVHCRHYSTRHCACRHAPFVRVRLSTLLVSALQADVAVDEAATDMAMLELSRENAKIQRVEFGDAKELLTEAYLDSLAVEAGEMAARRGRVTFAELASTFNLSVDVRCDLCSRLAFLTSVC